MPGSNYEWDKGDVRAGGQWFKRLRIERGWSQKDVEKQSGVSLQNVSQVELGAISKPSMAMLTQIGLAFGVSPDEIAAAYGWYAPRAGSAASEPAEVQRFKRELLRVSDGQRYVALRQLSMLTTMVAQEASVGGEHEGD